MTEQRFQIVVDGGETLRKCVHITVMGLLEAEADMTLKHCEVY